MINSVLIHFDKESKRREPFKKRISLIHDSDSIDTYEFFIIFQNIFMLVHFRWYNTEGIICRYLTFVTKELNSISTIIPETMQCHWSNWFIRSKFDCLIPWKASSLKLMEKGLEYWRWLSVWQVHCYFR